ncbi:MarR family winged helix-turn-helix transcriptional regulator [Paenibacillus segetis]|uniref:MarR family transcriptional regulator n=1 Tax=Paenibacillus segetis TaxID=1325360 RepID=A0ABQ1YGH7_9BACL|nr:MarR family transcriptional regulator [Paenibacillus segetis]GGH23500.1 MarR family transcriptional regulator [Paenibacillus segetis]
MDHLRELFLMQQIYGTLFSLSNKLQVQGDKYMENLTSRQFMTMVAILHLPEDETTVNNIARKLGTTKQSVKQMITVMENKGFVSTVPSQKDKRAINVKMTNTGKQVTQECGEQGIYFFADVFKDFTLDEMETLWGLLKKLYRFDGVEQDGFEEEAVMEMEEDQSGEQMRIFNEFKRRRTHSEK